MNSPNNVTYTIKTLESRTELVTLFCISANYPQFNNPKNCSVRIKKGNKSNRVISLFVQLYLNTVVLPFNRLSTQTANQASRVSNSVSLTATHHDKLHQKTKTQIVF